MSDFGNVAYCKCSKIWDGNYFSMLESGCCRGFRVELPSVYQCQTLSTSRLRVADVCTCRMLRKIIRYHAGTQYSLSTQSCWGHA